MTSTDQTAIEPAPCEWCGLLHVGPQFAPKLCPYVKAFEYRCDEAGTRYVSRVEFLTPADYQPIKGTAEPPKDEGGYPKLNPGRYQDGS